MSSDGDVLDAVVMEHISVRSESIAEVNADGVVVVPDDGVGEFDVVEDSPGAG